MIKDITSTKNETYKYIKVKKTYDETLYYYGIDDIEDADNDANELDDSSLNEDIPNFIYYASYASLDSEIHLPTVINNLLRNQEMSEKSKNKAKTLKVLFDYIDLKPQEILELGRESGNG